MNKFDKDIESLNQCISDKEQTISQLSTEVHEKKTIVDEIDNYIEQMALNFKSKSERKDDILRLNVSGTN